MSPPDILFKYRSLESEARAHTFQAISQREVRFSSLRDFNDPFEARVSIVLEGDDETWRRTFYQRPSDETIRAMIPDLEKGVRDDAEGLGMCCLSAKADDILMWSHYGACHRGVCLGFRTTGASILCDAQPVEYSGEYPIVDYFRMTKEERARAMLLRKAKHWEYEEEWRAIRTGEEPGVAQYPLGMLATIILGMGIAQTDREDVMQAATDLESAVEIIQARRNGTAYTLDLIRI